MQQARQSAAPVGARRSDTARPRTQNAQPHTQTAGTRPRTTTQMPTRCAKPQAQTAAPTRGIPKSAPARAPRPAKPTKTEKQIKAKRRKKVKDPNRIKLLDFHSRVDVPMLLLVMVLLVFGITMMFSAGHAFSYRDNDGDSMYYVTRQLTAAGLGLAGMFLLSFFDYRFLRYEFKLPGGKRRVTPTHIVVAVAMLLNLLTIPFGIAASGGQKRWLPIPGLGQFQPSDILKIAVIIYFAYYIHKNSDKMRKFYDGIWIPGLMLMLMILSMISQTHLSCMVIICLVFVAMLFVGGSSLKYLVPIFLLVVLAAVFAVMVLDVAYFKERIIYMDPLSDPGWKSYQNYQSALAIGSGGLWGKGFGNSSQKYFYLPEAPNDFVYAVLVEEFGFVGGFAVIVLFIIFMFRGFYIARKAEDKFGCLLATGITFQIGLQAFLNLGVNLCCIPNTGISMPFFSYGGTALMLQLWEMGLLLSVSKRAKLS